MSRPRISAITTLDVNNTSRFYRQIQYAIKHGDDRQRRKAFIQAERQAGLWETDRTCPWKDATTINYRDYSDQWSEDYHGATCSELWNRLVPD